MRNGNLLKSRVSEIRVKQIRVNQGVGVYEFAYLHHPQTKNRGNPMTQVPAELVILLHTQYTILGFKAS